MEICSCPLPPAASVAADCPLLRDDRSGRLREEQAYLRLRVAVAVYEEVAAGLGHDAVCRGQSQALVDLRILRREVRHERAADDVGRHAAAVVGDRSEEHTSELQSLM